MGPQVQSYIVYSVLKGWKTKRVRRTLTFQKKGQIQILGETDEIADVFFPLSDVYQIVWSDPTDASNQPILAFTFKDQRK